MGTGKGKQSNPTPRTILGTRRDEAGRQLASLEASKSGGASAVFPSKFPLWTPSFCAHPLPSPSLFSQLSAVYGLPPAPPPRALFPADSPSLLPSPQLTHRGFLPSPDTQTRARQASAVRPIHAVWTCQACTLCLRCSALSACVCPSHTSLSCFSLHLLSGLTLIFSIPIFSSCFLLPSPAVPLCSPPRTQVCETYPIFSSSFLACPSSPFSLVFPSLFCSLPASVLVSRWMTGLSLIFPVSFRVHLLSTYCVPRPPLARLTGW